MTGFSAKVRKIIHARSDHCCEVCGVEIVDGMSRSAHHRRPRGMGGNKSAASNSASAGLYLCGDGVAGCHGWIESHRPEAYELGLLVRQHEDPAEVPVSIKRGLVFLDDAGNYLEAA